MVVLLCEARAQSERVTSDPSSHHIVQANPIIYQTVDRQDHASRRCK